MDPKAFEKACASADTAQRKLEQMRVAPSLETLAEAWSEFLTATQRFYTAMVIACKTGPASAWWGTIKAERSSDPLLQYLHQARHADEHGISQITREEPGRLSIKSKGNAVHIGYLEISGGVIAADPQTAAQLNIEFRPSRLHLAEVVNRGVPYPPPTHHLGQVISDVNPISAAELTIGYIAGVRESARGFLK